MGHGSRRRCAEPSSDVSIAARDARLAARFAKGQGDSLGSSRDAQRPPRSPASPARTILPCSQGSLGVPRTCSRPTPYLQRAHPEGEDVHSSPVSFFCKSKPEPHQARGMSHHPGNSPLQTPLPAHPCPRLTPLCPRLLPPPRHTSSHSSLHKPFPFIPLEFAPKYSIWGSHHEFSCGTRILYSFFPNRCNILHAFECS